MLFVVISNQYFDYMFIFLLNVCDAIVISRQYQHYSSSLSQASSGQTEEKFEHHSTNLTQIGQNITAHESHRKRKVSGTVAQKYLSQKAGKKRNSDAATRTRIAMGFSQQLPGQQKKGRLDVTNTKNTPEYIAGIPFYPQKTPAMDTSRFLCHGGHCEETVADITGGRD